MDIARPSSAVPVVSFDGSAQSVGDSMWQWMGVHMQDVLVAAQQSFDLLEVGRAHKTRCVASIGPLATHLHRPFKCNGQQEHSIGLCVL